MNEYLLIGADCWGTYSITYDDNKDYKTILTPKYLIRMH